MMIKIDVMMRKMKIMLDGGHKMIRRIPEFCLSHWLLRIPIAIVFIQQGLSKFPVTLEDAQSFDLPYLVWWVVAYGESYLVE